MKKGTLILKDGHKFDGFIFGAEKSSAGEIVFSTGMVGYPESLTDPSYRGQILTFTYPLIGNYGVPKEEKDEYGLSNMFESDRIHVKGIVLSEYSENHSHWRAKQSLSDWLKKAGIPGITGIDTRELTKIIRTKGCMPAKIVVENAEDIELYDPNLTNLVAEVGVKKPVVYGNGKKTILMLDCGVKNNTIRNFLKRGFKVKRVPWNYDFLKEKFDGLFISNGPGDPTMIMETVNRVKEVIKQGKPIFGICLGNQVLALAAGAKTYKTKFGNRSQNQPCTDTETGRCYMTTQNHNYAVDEKTLPPGWKVWFYNENDKTVEGIKHKTKPFSAVQFHPEAYPGPVDTDFLFDFFATQIK
ncbi:glutamine-hydrolyzing carbamoyl-phosphate synthase small subunit [Candidatus Peregrinibacteria bacterium]|nr:glutamine-hydrolyzing carbamoyl-phosphate synthase small subunit [Candidatus Peregrinibacteria bacterium]